MDLPDSHLSLNGLLIFLVRFGRCIHRDVWVFSRLSESRIYVLSAGLKRRSLVTGNGSRVTVQRQRVIGNWYMYFNK